MALDTLQRFDKSVVGAQQNDPVARAERAKIASDVFWLYVVQQEALRLVDADHIRREYNVPTDVWRRAGA